MIDTAITADAEVRRLRRLGEAKHDWCEACPPAESAPRDAWVSRGRRALAAALRRAASHASPRHAGSSAELLKQSSGGEVARP